MTHFSEIWINFVHFRASEPMETPSKYAYFVVNDSDDLEELQQCLAPFGGIEAMKDVIIDYALDKRRITDLIKCCNKYDIIYTPYIARLGKSLKELYQIVSIANEYEVNLIFCDKLNVSFSETNLNGKINLASLQWAVELQAQIISENSKAGLSRKQDDISRTGNSRNKRGANILRLGRPADGIDDHGRPYWDLSAAAEAASQKRMDEKIRWKESSTAYRWTMARVKEGMPRKEIVRLFNEQHELNPDVYCTRTGKPLTEATLSIWIKEIQNT